LAEGGEEVTGAAVSAKAQEWADAGTMEPDVVGALAEFTAHCDQWAGEDLKETVFVLLGGTSELCPLAPLLARGATVAGVYTRSR
jgi:hypothetical protein